MKASETRMQEERRQRSQAALDRHLAELFRRLPMLPGFTLQQDLDLGDVTVHSWPGYVAGEELYKDLTLALAELAEERPEAIELLRPHAIGLAHHERAT